MTCGLAVLHGLMMTPIEILQQRHPSPDQYRGLCPTQEFSTKSTGAGLVFYYDFFLNFHYNHVRKTVEFTGNCLLKNPVRQKKKWKYVDCSVRLHLVFLLYSIRFLYSLLLPLLHNTSRESVRGSWASTASCGLRDTVVVRDDFLVPLQPQTFASCRLSCHYTGKVFTLMVFFSCLTFISFWTEYLWKKL